MTSLQVLEAVLSLSIQLVILVSILNVMSRRIRSAVSRERLLTIGMIAICLSTLAVFAFPHVRLLSSGWLNSILIAVDTDAFARLELGLLIVWAAGAAITIVKLSVAIVMASLFVRAARPATTQREGLNELWLSELSRVKIPGRHEPQLLVSEHSTGPACWQFHWPLIIFHPRILEQCPLPQLQMMIRHEMVHLARQHPFQLFLQRLVAVVFWFHPVVWRLSEELSKVREMACDEMSIESSVDAATYLRSLLTVGAFRQNDMELPDELLAFRKGRDWVGERAGQITARPWEHAREKIPLQIVITLVSATLITLCVRVPLSPEISRDELWSPWPDWSAQALHAVGFNVRDYEPHGYRLPGHEHHFQVLPDDYDE